MISIQSLMSSNPYENEPGFETANEEGDKKNQKDYVNKVRLNLTNVRAILTFALDSARIPPNICNPAA